MRRLSAQPHCVGYHPTLPVSSEARRATTPRPHWVGWWDGVRTLENQEPPYPTPFVSSCSLPLRGKPLGPIEMFAGVQLCRYSEGSGS